MRFVLKYLFGSSNEASRGALTCTCERRLVRFSLEEIKYLIFSFLRSGLEAKRGVEFCRSTRTASRIREMGSGAT